MPLVDQPFEATFVFARARRAPCRNAAGRQVLIPAHQPRFDHDRSGRPLGLLVEGRPATRRPDVLTVRAGDWAVDSGTVLHELETPAGALERTAWFARRDPRPVVDACLSRPGRHRRIVYLPGYLKNRDGQVRWRNLDWTLGGVLLARTGEAFSPGAGHLLIQG